MQRTFHELRISAEVPGGTEASEEFTPPLGATSAWIEFFSGSAAFNADACCKLIWKFDTAQEQPLWNINGDSLMPTVIYLPNDEIDGVNKIAITLDNAGIAPIYLSAFARIGVEVG